MANEKNEMVVKKLEWFKSANKKVKKQLNAQITAEDTNSFVVEIPVLVSLDENGMLAKLEYDVLSAYETIQNENLCKFCKKTMNADTEMITTFGNERFHTECYIKDMAEQKNTTETPAEKKEQVNLNNKNNNNNKKVG